MSAQPFLDNDWVPRERFERERRARKEAERLLQEKARELYDAKKARDRFLKNVNHEFRTPLNGIMSPAQLLQYGSPDVDAADLGRVIEECAKQLLDLVETSVEVARGKSASPDEKQTELAPLILIVDDNPVNRMVAKAAIGAIGMRTLLAENGRDALAALSKTRPDVILMDIQMPIMDGETAIKKIRESREHWCDVPIVVFTADADPNGRERYEQIGANDYLTKPMDVAVLQSTLSGVLETGRN